MDRAIAKNQWNAAASRGLHDLIDVSVNLIFPPACSFCHVELTSDDTFGLCDQCCATLGADKEADFCERCGTLSLNSVFGLSKCPECDNRNYRFDQIIPLGIFRGDLRQALIRTKSFNHFPLARSIGQLTGSQVKTVLANNPADFAISIPRYWMKRLLNGTNGAETLASEIAKMLRIPFYPRTLRWVRNIRKQSLLSVTERRRNVRGALKLASGYDVGGSHVLVIDDTMTTGATANEAAAVLKKAGAERVTVAVAARASNLDTLDAFDLRSANIAESGNSQAIAD